jgi:hypothetical protein
MKFRLLTATLLFTVLAAVPAHAQKDEQKAIKAVINRFFEAMAKGDSAMLRSTCMAEPVLQTYMADREGQLQLFTEEFNEFVAFVGTPSKDKYREEIQFEGIHAEKSLASVWTPYVFYVNDKVAHCGTNSFQLIKTAEGWKIQYIIDTRRRAGCQ